MKSRAWRVLLWTGVALACLIAAPIAGLLGALEIGQLKTYRIPSQGMAPTLEEGDRILALMTGVGTPRRGDVIAFEVGRSTYLQRIAALAGDRIAMTGGVVVLNGRPIVQRPAGLDPRPNPVAPERVRRLIERFPGEARSHEILDMGTSATDDIAEQRVPPGFLFVLGDNRDQSADSRVPRTEMGVALLPESDVRGHALFVTWPRAKFGRSIER